MTSVDYGNYKTVLSTSGITNAVFDTSAPFIFMPQTDYDNFLVSVSNAGLDCSGDYCYTNDTSCWEI